MNILTEKIREVFVAVLPICIIVLLLHFTFVPLSLNVLFSFLLGSFFVVIGLSFFLIGVDLGISPFGQLVGSEMAKRNKLSIIVVFGFILGFFISFAEPGLLILAMQIDGITLGGISYLSIMITVSLGIAITMVVGFLRILYNFPLYLILIFFYTMVFVLGFFISPEFLAIAFDTSGATTGVLAVPFILSLSLGITAMKKDSKASEKDSFGLVAITSVGAIIAVMLLNVFSKNQDFSGVLELTPYKNQSIWTNFISLIPVSLKDALMAMLPLMVLFVLGLVFVFILSKKSIKRMSFGLTYAFLGLFLFFVGVNAGFMNVGTMLGSQLSKLSNTNWLVIFGFVLGVTTILAEPAVYVLTHQIEEVTSGYVKRIYVLAALSLGVGVAVALSMLRILIPSIQLWHYILPGYILSIGLMFFVPKLFIGIAFDAGGVATGPMTATFILAFTHGAANAFPTANLMIDGFGMIAMVAMMPIISIQMLGVVFKVKSKRGERK